MLQADLSKQVGSDPVHLKIIFKNRLRKGDSDNSGINVTEELNNLIIKKLHLKKLLLTDQGVFWKRKRERLQTRCSSQREQQIESFKHIQGHNSDFNNIGKNGKLQVDILLENMVIPRLYNILMLSQTTDQRKTGFQSFQKRKASCLSANML